MDHALEIMRSPPFMLGALAGVVFGYLCWFLSSSSRINYYKTASDMKSAVKIGDKFYYIVPETTYVQEQLVKVCRTPISGSS